MGRKRIRGAGTYIWEVKGQSKQFQNVLKYNPSKGTVNLSLAEWFIVPPASPATIHKVGRSYVASHKFTEFYFSLLNICLSNGLSAIQQVEKIRHWKRIHNMHKKHSLALFIMTQHVFKIKILLLSNWSYYFWITSAIYKTPETLHWPEHLLTSLSLPILIIG